MIIELIEEINQSLDNGCVMAGLSLALILPDICGKAIYPELKPSKRYIDWFDNNISQYEDYEKPICTQEPFLNGQLIYSLRNSILHQGSPNINNNKFGIMYFELLYRQHEGAHKTMWLCEGIKSNNDGSMINKKICINVRYLCKKICDQARRCYIENKEKFDFFNYNLVDIDYYTRHVFGIKSSKVIK